MMPISVNPIFPIIAAQGVAPDLVLQPGTVVDAQVVRLLADNMVRIAIASLSIDVLSEIPLQAGQVLQLAVSQTPDGIKLAVVGQGAGATGPSLDSVTLAPAALADAAANAPVNTASPRIELTSIERLAVATAAQLAAPQQDSLAPLFANLGVVAGSNGLPPKLQQAVMQVLAQRTSLDQNLVGNDVKHAFQKSGLFLEAALAAGSVSPAGTPDLKAALIVLRQTLLLSLGGAGAVLQGPATSAADAAVSLRAAEKPALAPSSPQAAGKPALAPSSPLVAEKPALAPSSPLVAEKPALAPSSPLATEKPTLAPSLAPELEIQEILLPQARVPVAVDFWDSSSAEPRPVTAAAVLNLLQEAMQEIPGEGVNAPPVPATLKGGRSDEVAVHVSPPPPPFRGALPSAQPVALPTMTSSAPLATAAHHLLGDTDAAIARQTLLQVASLPDRIDTSGPRLDSTAPRWNFEIPFVIPQGTAMAQFEISRDGGHESKASKRVWRARFSLDVEPAGPVHALVSLTGERTSVRIWAERPTTAAQLRAGASQLSQALSKAELQPGDIVIADGAPPQPAPAPAGHFLDRAL